MITITTDRLSFFDEVFEQGETVFLYGAGIIGEKIGRVLLGQSVFNFNYIDNNLNINKKMLNGKTIYHPTCIPKSVKYVILTVTQKTVADALLTMEKYLHNALVLCIPDNGINYFLGYFRKQRLLNDSFTLISNNCCAGVLYKALSCENKSPTINLIIRPDDYVKFCLNLNHYLSQPLEFVGQSHRPSTAEHYPIAKLSDIYIHFVHYENFEIAALKWNERKERINHDLIYYIFDDFQFPIYNRHLELFSQIESPNKIAFLSRSFTPRYDFALYTSYEYKILHPDTIYEDWFDFVDWINSGVLNAGN